MRRALVTGVTGQDGSYLAELLATKGYQVHGFARRGSHVPPGVIAHEGDLLDPAALRRALAEARPDEVYNLGAQSHVASSFDEPIYTMRSVVEPLTTILEWASHYDVKVYQASSSEMFGDARPPQNERSPFRPRSPYAIAKVAAHQLVRLYRENYGVFVVGGILFNHESPRRPRAFVTRKVTSAAARIALGLDKDVTLGNLSAERDWGWAPDYVEAMWRMLQAPAPDDFVIATGEMHSVSDLVAAAFDAASELTGSRVPVSVRLDDRLVRKAEVPALLGDASKAREQLGWATTVTFREMVRRMVAADLDYERTQQNATKLA